MSTLLNTEIISSRYSTMIHSDSHGSSGEKLGLGAVYYAFCHAINSQVSVCIGSGAGFVPGLLRQAQLDAGLEPSITYLIDANLPELGFGGPSLPGGWMTENSDFLSWAEDVVVLPMLSRVAASLFASNFLKIDYLHIDGDHSKSGVLSDLRDYVPLTSETAVISLHDFGLASLREAVSEFMDDNPGWDQFVFEEIGTGCCFLRRQLPIGYQTPKPRDIFPFSMLPPLIYEDTKEEEDLELKVQFEKWPYLEGRGFRLRYEFAARFVDDPAKLIVEIGGFPNSIVEYLDHSKQIYAVEPYMPDKYVEEVRSRAAQKGVNITFFKGTAGNCALHSTGLSPFNLFALGFDLSEGIENEHLAYLDLLAMANLMIKAETIVIELPEYEASQLAWNCLEKALRPCKCHEVVLDLRDDPSAKDYVVRDGRAIRRLFVLKGGDPHAPDVRDVILKQGAEDLIKLKPAHLVRIEPDYNLGEHILFGKEGNGTKYLRRGWSYLEDGLVWCQGSTSRLELLLADESIDQEEGDFLLHLRVWPAGKPNEHPVQRLAISINGEELFSECMDLGRHDVKVQISATLLIKKNPVEIQLDHPDAVKPCELFPEENADQRTLAFACELLCLSRCQ